MTRDDLEKLAATSRELRDLEALHAQVMAITSMSTAWSVYFNGYTSVDFNKFASQCGVSCDDVVRTIREHFAEVLEKRIEKYRTILAESNIS